MNRSRVFALLFLLLSAVSAHAAEPVVTAVELKNPSRVPDAEILRIFRPKAGEPYEAAEIRRSLQLLTSMPGVRNVLIRTRAEEEGTRISLDVLPEPLVREVDFSGASLFSDRELLEGLRTKVDFAAYPASLDADAQSLAARYAAEGYPKASVSSLVEPTASPHWVDVEFRIEEGEPLRVTGYGDLGDADHFGRERFLDLLGMEPGATASEKALREGVKELLETCRDEGFVEARVTKAWFDPSPDGAMLSVAFQLGRKTSVSIEGYESDALDAILADRLGEAIDEEWVQSTARRMKELLAEDGFLAAEVVPEETADDQGVRRIVFRATPGTRWKLAQVRFLGNASISDERLLDLMKADDTEWLAPPPLRRKVLQADVEILKQFYLLEGYIRAEVALQEIDAPPDGSAVASLDIREGDRYRIREVTCEVDGEKPYKPGEALALTGLAPGDVASPARVDKARVLLLADLAKRGYSEAQVDQEVAILDADPLVDVRLLVRPGVYRSVGTLFVAGNARTKAETVLREVSLKPGEPFNLQEALLSRQRLMRLGFFQDVEILPVGEPRAGGATDVQILVQEQDAGHIDYGVGYGTEEGPTAFLEVGHTNLMGEGRSLSLRIDVEGNNRGYALNFREPYLFGSRFDLRLSLINRREEREAYVLQSSAFQTSLDRELLESLRASLMYTLEENRLSEVQPGAVLEDEDDEPYLLSSLGPFLVWDSRDDPFNPRSGFHHTVQAEWASDVIGSDVNYVKYIAMVSGYVTLDRFTLGLLARAGLADFFGKDPNLPVNKRFFLGGRSTVRGFGRDEVGPKADDGTPIGGDVMVNLKAELRFPLYKEFGMALFWDAGQVWIREQDRVAWRDLRHAAGGGFRYDTPVGPIALDVGFKLDREEDEDSYEWHFTIGNVF